MRKAYRLASLLLLLLPAIANAQNNEPEMATTFRSQGKIYVVVLVLATIFAGIIAFLVYLERKINKVEKNQHS